jgi:thiamine-phosphate pyrophosphorylase
LRACRPARRSTDAVVDLDEQTVVSARALPQLLCFTDAAMARTRGRGVVDTVVRMLAGHDVGGRVAVVVRDKVASVDDVAALCGALRPVCQRGGALLLVHTHVPLVAALRLDGAHLDGRADVGAARARLPHGCLLGASRHRDDVDGQGLGVAGADYATLSPIFAPTSKPDDARAPLGPAALRGHRLPVYALGGVDEENAAACIAAGAAGVAVLGGLMAATDPSRSLTALLRALAPPASTSTVRSRHDGP